MCCRTINEYINPLVPDSDGLLGQKTADRRIYTKRVIASSLFLISLTALVCTLLIAMNVMGSKEMLIATSVTAGAFFIMGCIYSFLLARTKATAIDKMWEAVITDIYGTTNPNAEQIVNGQRNAYTQWQTNTEASDAKSRHY